MKKIKKIRLIGLCVAFAFIALASMAQNANDIQTITVNKLVKDFLVEYKQDTPLDAYLSIAHIYAYGKRGLLKAYSSYSLHYTFPQKDTPDESVSDEQRDKILNRKILECIIYKDSAAAVIYTIGTNPMYFIRSFSKENGKWLNSNEIRPQQSIEKAKESIIPHLFKLAASIQRTERLKQIPTDTLAFVNYLKANGKPPHQYVIEKLAKHKLVIYGEIHRRKVSWNLLTKVTQEPDFVKTTGTVFFELPSHKQKDLDRFYAQDTVDKSILLDIFGCLLINGWYDKDEMDFMITLWKLNKTLPENQQIKVVLADFQPPWDSLKTKEDYEDYKNLHDKDRDTHMADVIEQTLKTTTDNRHTLFIVGDMHAYKSPDVPGHDAAEGEEPAPTAGAQLVERLSNENVFCIFPHQMTISNAGEIEGKLRFGLFDYAFDMNKNIPVAFDLAGSPFGNEPLDAILEEKYNPKMGRYEDNYDGYIFFQKLEREEKGNRLYELVTDEFVNEIKRRLYITGIPEDEVWGYDTPVKDLTKEIILEKVKQWGKGKQWWIANE